MCCWHIGWFDKTDWTHSIHQTAFHAIIFIEWKWIGLSCALKNISFFLSQKWEFFDLRKCYMLICNGHSLVTDSMHCIMDHIIQHYREKALDETRIKRVPLEIYSWIPTMSNNTIFLWCSRSIASAILHQSWVSLLFGLSHFTAGRLLLNRTIVIVCFGCCCSSVFCASLFSLHVLLYLFFISECRRIRSIFTMCTQRHLFDSNIVDAHCALAHFSILLCSFYYHYVLLLLFVRVNSLLTSSSRLDRTIVQQFGFSIPKPSWLQYLFILPRNHSCRIYLSSVDIMKNENYNTTMKMVIIYISLKFIWVAQHRWYCYFWVCA